MDVRKTIQLFKLCYLLILYPKDMNIRSLKLGTVSQQTFRIFCSRKLYCARFHFVGYLWGVLASITVLYSKALGSSPCEARGFGSNLH